LFGCLLIIGVFLIATAQMSWQMRSLRPVAEEMQTLSDGIRSSLMLGNALREQYAHQAHLLITREAGHAEHAVIATQTTGEWMRRMKALLTEPDEAELFEELTRTVEECKQIFGDQIVPLLKKGETERVLALHDRCERLVGRSTGLIDRIVQRFTTRFEAAREEIVAASSRVFTTGIVCVVLALVVAISVAVRLSRSIARPIGTLIDGTRDVATGNLGKTLAVGGADEFEELARAFNTMSRKVKERQLQLIESEKLATLGRLAAAVAHELNNPLGIILGYLKTMSKGRVQGDPVLGDLKTLEDEANQCRKIVADLLSLARPTDIDVTEIELDVILRETVERLGRQETFARISMACEIEGDLWVLGDPEKLKQVVKNIAANAAEAMGAGGSLRIAARRVAWTEAQDPATAEAVEVVFADSGPGIPEVKLRDVFEPFFTTKKDGTGLGLFICYHIIKAHGGTIHLQSTAGSGTTVTLTLPALSSRDAS
jgi:signal transduction histidine kinase